MPQANVAKSSQVGLFQCVPLGVPAETEQTLCRFDQEFPMNQLLGVKAIGGFAPRPVISYRMKAKPAACSRVDDDV